MLRVTAAVCTILPPLAVVLWIAIVSFTWLRGRRDAPSPAQQRVFAGAPRFGLIRKVMGLALEGFWQTTALLLEFIRFLGSRKWSPDALLSGNVVHVLLLVGYTENGGQMRVLASRLARHGLSTSVVDLPCSFNSIDSNVEFLRRRLHEAADALDDRVVLVGHSMVDSIRCAIAHANPAAISSAISRRRCRTTL